MSTTPRESSEYDTSAKTPNLAMLPVPHLHIYVQTDATRTNVDADPQYAAIRDLIRTLLTHMVASNRLSHILKFFLGVISGNPANTAAREALTRRLGSKRSMESTDITKFLLEHTPAVIFNLWGTNRKR